MVVLNPTWQSSTEKGSEIQEFFVAKFPTQVRIVFHDLPGEMASNGCSNLLKKCHSWVFDSFLEQSFAGIQPPPVWKIEAKSLCRNPWDDFDVGFFREFDGDFGIIQVSCILEVDDTLQGLGHGMWEFLLGNLY